MHARSAKPAAPASGRLGPGLSAALVTLAGLSAVSAVLAQTPSAATAPAAAALCMACHGPGGNSAQAELPSIAGQPRTFIENQLVLIREGLRDVPSMKAVMGTLDDAQIVELARHFAALPTEAPAAPAVPQQVLAGAEIARKALCGTCHLPNFQGQSQVPRLAGQQQAYLMSTMKMYRDKPDPGRDTLMSAPLRGMSDADLGRLAHYFSQLGR